MRSTARIFLNRSDARPLQVLLLGLVCALQVGGTALFGAGLASLHVKQTHLACGGLFPSATAVALQWTLAVFAGCCLGLCAWGVVRVRPVLPALGAVLAAIVLSVMLVGATGVSGDPRLKGNLACGFLTKSAYDQIVSAKAFYLAALAGVALVFVLRSFVGRVNRGRARRMEGVM